MNVMFQRYEEFKMYAMQLYVHIFLLLVLLAEL